METKANAAKSIVNSRELPVIQNQLQRHGKNLKQNSCGFNGYDAATYE
jgi:hypothetical protein